jgi:hypothetical protein
LCILVYAVIEFEGQVRTDMQLSTSFAKRLGEGRAGKIALRHVEKFMRARRL